MNKEKWKKIKNNKNKFIFLQVPFLRIIPLGILIFFIFQLFEQGLKFYTSYNFNFKLISAFIILTLLGILTGIIEFSFYKRKYEKDNIKNERNYQAFITGVLNWGLLIGIAQVISQTTNYQNTLITLFTWILFGYFYGLFIHRK